MLSNKRYDGFFSKTDTCSACSQDGDIVWHYTVSAQPHKDVPTAIPFSDTM